MGFHVVKYVGERVATIWDALKNNKKDVKNGEYFLSDDNEVSRLRSLPKQFKVIKEIEIEDLLQGALENIRKPYAHPQQQITRGKILFLFNSEGGQYVGQKIWEFQIAMALAKMGFGVHVLTDEIPPYASEWPDANKISWERATTSSYIGFDYVIGTSPSSLEMAVRYGKKNQIPSILICGEPISVIPGRREGEETLMEYDRYLKEANKLIVPSETVRSIMVAKGVDRSNVLVISPTINPNLLLVNLVNKQNEIVICSRTDPHKDLQGTIRTLLLHPIEFGITCIVGNPKELQEEFGEGNVNHKLTFVGQLSEHEKARVFARAKAIVHPSMWEGFGIVVLEALVLGAKVIARPLSTFKEIYGSDLEYFSNQSELIDRITEVFVETTFDTQLTNKYREIAQTDSTEELTKLFLKKPITLPVDTSRIALIGWSNRFGGGDVARYEQAKALKAAGYKVEIGCWDNISFDYKGFDVNLLKTPDDIESWLRSKRPGAIICDSSLASEIMPTAKKLSIPVALFIHFWTPFFRETKGLLDKKAGNNLLREDKLKLLDDASVIFSNSDYTKEVFKKHLKINTPVVYPAIDSKRLKARGKFTRDNILTPILEEEGEGLALYEKILKALPNRNFVVLYWRGPEETLKRLKAEHKNLTVLGGVKDIARHYKSAKILLYTLQVDHSFGLVFAEALMTKTPVIAPKLGNIPNLVNKGGFLIKGTKVKEWVEKIESCFMNNRLYGRLQRAAEADAKKLPKPDHSKLVDRIQEILSRTKKVSLTCGNFLASRHTFSTFAKLLDWVELDAPEAEAIIAFGPAEFWPERVSPQTYSYWASPPLQSGLDNEIKWLEETIELINKGELAGLISPSEPLLLVARAMGCKKLYHLPVPAPIMQPLKNVVRKKHHVSLFSGGYPRKNSMNQILAAIKTDPNLTLHVAERVAEKLPKGLLKAIGVVKYGHLDDASYFSLLASCSAGLQVTISESFNLAAFQHLALGTPCLISRSCPYWKDLPKKFSYLVVNDIEDVDEISGKLKLALEEKDHEGLSKWASNYAIEWNKKVRTKFTRIFSR